QIFRPSWRTQSRVFLRAKIARVHYLAGRNRSMKKPAASKSNDDMLTAIELANLAAILRPKARPAAAMKAAMELYVEAVIFCGDYGSKTFEELFDQFGSEERHRAQIVGNLERELKAARE